MKLVSMALAGMAALMLAAGCSDSSPTAPGTDLAGKNSQVADPGADAADLDDVQEEVEEEGQVVALSDVPAVVIDAITAALPLGVIQQVELELEDGVEIYEAEVLSEGQLYELEIDDAGTVLEMELDDDDESDDDDDVEHESEGDDEHED